MSCIPLTKEQADELREKYWPKLVDALGREPGESYSEWETRAAAARDEARLIRDGVQP